MKHTRTVGYFSCDNCQALSPEWHEPEYDCDGQPATPFGWVVLIMGDQEKHFCGKHHVELKVSTPQEQEK